MDRALDPIVAGFDPKGVATSQRELHWMRSLKMPCFHLSAARELMSGIP
jgi:hypothetical protein